MRTAAELGAIAKARRVSLGRTQVGVVQKAVETMGAEVISEPTYRSIENGRTEASDRTLAAASVGLDWPAPTLANIRAGDEPPSDTIDLTTPPPWEEILTAIRDLTAVVNRLDRKLPDPLEQ